MQGPARPLETEAGLRGPVLKMGIGVPEGQTLHCPMPRDRATAQTTLTGSVLRDLGAANGGRPGGWADGADGPGSR